MAPQPKSRVFYTTAIVAIALGAIAGWLGRGYSDSKKYQTTYARLQQQEERLQQKADEVRQIQESLETLEPQIGRQAKLVNTQVEGLLETSINQTKVTNMLQEAVIQQIRGGQTLLNRLESLGEPDDIVIAREREKSAAETYRFQVWADKYKKAVEADEAVIIQQQKLIDLYEPYYNKANQINPAASKPTPTAPIQAAPTPTQTKEPEKPKPQEKPDSLVNQFLKSEKPNQNVDELLKLAPKK